MGIQATTPSDYNAVWNNTIEYFKSKNIPVKHSDKNDGFIETETVNVPWTREKKSTPNKPEAHVVVIKVVNGSSNHTVNYNNVTARYRVSLVKDGSNVKVIPVVYEIKVDGQETYSDMKVNNPARKTYPFGKSTGVFENDIINAVK